jgi:hypothetical protein
MEEERFNKKWQFANWVKAWTQKASVEFFQVSCSMTRMRQIPE